ncbi:VOC family protein [Candidatus Saccharibacteria bacterium]|nr:VOC family protein [Candidatus Saccharibacteria bacterium]
MTANNQRLVPFLTFHGNAEEAMNFYAKVLPDAKIESIVHVEPGQPGDAGKVLHGALTFTGQQIMFMDMAAANELPPFSWSMSLYLECKDDAEFDAVFNGLSEGGTVMMGPEPVMQFKKVAWVTDKFGVTWQPVLAQE